MDTNTRTYSPEDPVEHRIDGIAQLSVRLGKESTVCHEDPSAGWRKDGLLEKLGSVVASERADGSMAHSTWVGSATTVLAKFDVERLPPLVNMRQHMVDAISIDQPRPLGFIKVICFAL